MIENGLNIYQNDNNRFLDFFTPVFLGHLRLLPESSIYQEIVRIEQTIAFFSLLVSQSGSHISWAPRRFLLIYDFRHISFVSPSAVFHFIVSSKVAMGLTVNNFWSVHQITMMLYIFVILRALSVEPYQNIKILT